MKHSNGKHEHNNRSKSKFMNNNKHNNIKRLGGKGLSLEAFANAKSTTDYYNPALIKKQREFYKNAKHVNKYKKLVKHQNQPNERPSSSTVTLVEGENETKFENQTNDRCGKERNKGVPSLQALYERKHEEKEKARMEKEAIIAAKKEERERAKARRNSTREKMFKRTQKGQPVMKYRIEHLLETIGASTNH
ncbi:uncharacterized protein LOC101216293 [Cucumis sativus]|uniref:rRNA-processing protein FYV7 n=1 Tax=Cucumis sativus TaxID=3659 RepID=A0A0A0K7L3_CUCSA|nr:uncharacterized protein LOC101216293 [Cucumis sativus]KGN44879.1 hypothetical protein Csa_016715 [Cucumis sativus]